jgi:hypothetical protein
MILTAEAQRAQRQEKEVSVSHLGSLYQMFLRFEPAKTVVVRYEIRLIIYNPNDGVIERWID